MAKNISRKFFSISIFLFTALICFYLFLHSSFFSVESIYVTGSEKVTEKEIINLAGISLGTNIFKINDRLCMKAIEIHPLIKSAEMVRHLPREIEIQVAEREIWALIPYEDVVLCIDEEGVCIDKLAHSSFLNYPVITLEKIPGYVTLGQTVQSEGIPMIREIWDALPSESREEISDFYFSDKTREVIIYTEQGTEVRFGGLERLPEKVELFSGILQIEKDLQEKGREVLEYVDLRFEGQPVVKTSG